MKRCSNCKAEKPLSEFNKDKTKKDGLQHNCKLCQRLVWLKNAKRNKIKRAEWYQKNKEERDRKKREWKEKNREYYKKQRHEYYLRKTEGLVSKRHKQK